MEKIKVITDRDNLIAIAEAVRSKTGNTNNMTIRDIINGINKLSIPSESEGSSGGSSSSGQNLTNEITIQKQLISRLNQILGIKKETDEEDPDSEIDTFTASASGRVPEYEHGYAVAVLQNIFTTSVTGIIE